MPNQPGIDDHSQKAEALAEGYAKIDREAINPGLFSQLKEKAAQGIALDILDIGCGSGNDAFAMAQLGHRVDGVEPSHLRHIAERDFMHPNISYHDDLLPTLSSIHSKKYDVILLSGVWQYIDPAEEAASLQRIGQLLKPGGTIINTFFSPPSREFQFEKDEASFRAALAQANQGLPPNAQLNLTSAPEILPDSRGRQSADGRPLQSYTYHLSSPARAMTLGKGATTLQR